MTHLTCTRLTDTLAVKQPLRILMLGASYGSLLGLRIAAAGHSVTFACQEQEAVLINAGKIFLRLPTRDRTAPVLIGVTHCAVAPDAGIPTEIDPAPFDLVCLAMAEPQYSAAGIRDLIQRVAAAGTPCLSIMNMPLPPFLSKITALDEPLVTSVFTEASLWAHFDPDAFTMASADPQTMRIEDDDALVSAVTLPTNFKVAPFRHHRHQVLLERLSSDIDACRIDLDGSSCHPFVRLRAHPSGLAPLAKWPMLITGNFRCLRSGEPVSICEAVNANLTESRDVYDWVSQVCRLLGAGASTMVPFDRYLAATGSLSLPSSLARVLNAGAAAVERVDRLIQILARRFDRSHPVLDGIIDEVDTRLSMNRRRDSDHAKAG